MTIKDRVITFIKSQNMRVVDFEKRCNLSNGYISSMRKGFGDTKLNNVLKEFPELNRDWLLYGEGSMIKEGPSAPSPEDNHHDFGLVPLINIDSVGGISSSNEFSPAEQHIQRLIPFVGARTGDIAIYQTGDSMIPVYPSGSLLHLRPVPNWREYFGYGNDFVIELADERRITKQVIKYSPDPHNFITCHSYNPDYADEELPKSFIVSVWKVLNVLLTKGW